MKKGGRRLVWGDDALEWSRDEALVREDEPVLLSS